MNTKNILIVSKSFYPGVSPRSFRATELAKEFAKQGHKVTVFTPVYNLNCIDFEKVYNVQVINIGELSFPNIVVKTNRIISFITRSINRVLDFLFHYPDIELLFKIPKALKNEAGYDLLISLAFPYTVHWGCARAITKNPNLTKKWIADCGDPFKGYETGYRRAFYFKFFDEWFMKKIDYLSIPYEELKKYYYKIYHSKIVIIPQGFSFQDLKLFKYVKNEIVTFAYAGLFIPNFRDPSKFLNHLIHMDIDFRFFVFTNTPELLIPFKKKLGQKLIISPYISRNELITELSKMDFLINIENGNKKDYPSKLIDYSLSQRPILSINSFTLNKKAINEFISGNYSEAFIIPDLEKHNIKNVAQKFISLL